MHASIQRPQQLKTSGNYCWTLCTLQLPSLTLYCSRLIRLICAFFWTWGSKKTLQKPCIDELQKIIDSLSHPKGFRFCAVHQIIVDTLYTSFNVNLTIAHLWSADSIPNSVVCTSQVLIPGCDSCSWSLVSLFLGHWAWNLALLTWFVIDYPCSSTGEFDGKLISQIGHLPK